MIEVKNLTFSYNGKDKAVNKVSFSVADHEWLSILGHNGSGKSTIAKLLIGLLEAKSGEILYDGVKLSIDTVDDIRRRVGIVFQNPDNQFVGFNVKYDIAFGLENRCIRREDMIELIEKYTTKVGMADCLEREPHTLSGGQKQRVAIAGILAMNCDIVILDEATSMLDPQGVRDITELIVELKEKYNKTIITITHDLDLAGLSDRIIVMKEGSIISEGKPQEIFKERNMLKSSNLDMPFGLRMYDEASRNPRLNTNEELMEALWEYHLKG